MSAQQEPSDADFRRARSKPLLTKRLTGGETEVGCSGFESRLRHLVAHNDKIVLPHGRRGLSLPIRQALRMLVQDGNLGDLLDLTGRSAGILLISPVIYTEFEATRLGSHWTSHL